MASSLEGLSHVKRTKRPARGHLAVGRKRSVMNNKNSHTPTVAEVRGSLLQT